MVAVSSSDESHPLSSGSSEAFQRSWEALHRKRLMNLPAFERLVRAHIPRGVADEWRSVQDYTLRDLKDAMK